MKASDRKKRFDGLTEIGCVVCRLYQGVHTEPEIHHVKGHPWSGMGMRASDEHTIPLCPVHHRTGAPEHPGYHDSPAEFERCYGTQAELLEVTDRMLEALAVLKGVA